MRLIDIVGKATVRASFLNLLSGPRCKCGSDRFECCLVIGDDIIIRLFLKKFFFWVLLS